MNPLQTNEAVLASVVRDSPVAIVLSTFAEGEILDVNHRFLQVSGYTRDEVIGQTAIRLGLWADPNQRAQLAALPVTTQPRRDLEVTLRDRSGAERQVLATVSQIEVAGRACLLSQLNDVTAQRHEQIQFRALVEQIPVITYVGAPTDLMTLTYISPQCEAILGYSPADVLAGQPSFLACRTHPEDSERVRNAVERARRTSSILYVEYQLRAADDRWVWLRDEAVLVRDPQGRPLHWQGVLVDVTPRKAAETTLRESEERFRAVWEATSEAMALSDPEGIVLAVNPAYCALYGLIPEQVVGRSFAIIFPEAARAAAEAEYRAVFAAPDAPASYESRVQHGDGGERFVEARASFLVRDGERVAMISAIRDITERKRAERVQQDFIAMASHDLLTPVTVLRARAQLLQRRRTYDEASVASILEQSSRMERLIIDLREMVRVEGGRLALRRELVDLSEIVHEAFSRARTQGTQHPLRIEAPPSPIVGFWDRDRLGQVLDNLIGNAIKYSPRGGDIAIRIEATDAEALVKIEDQGIGISGDVLPRLFERFFQGQDPGVSTGLGLGLYIARMLVEAHGGRIWAESEPDRGSTFAISLPR